MILHRFMSEAEYECLIAGIANAHPHRLRRTCATFALRRGMPIEQVCKMLGHASIETTTIYANSTMDEVKASHEKYLT